MEIQPCPCCRGEAIYADLLLGDTLMWQISCTACGLSSELDEDKLYTAERWNMRREKASVKMWVTVLTIILPATAVSCFLLGALFGVDLNS